jgi:hypothetical protein
MRATIMADMSFVRNRARLVAAVAVIWHVAAIAVVSTLLSCGTNAASEHAGMPDCPLHESAPACPLHAEKHGTHECDCPTIGCSQTDTGLIALLGVVGILADASDLPTSVDAGEASTIFGESLTPLATPPLAPPPRA